MIRMRRGTSSLAIVPGWVAVFLGCTGHLVGQAPTDDPIKAFLACEETLVSTESVTELLECYTPDSRLAQLSPEVIEEHVLGSAILLTDRDVAIHEATEEAAEIRVKGALDEAPGIQIVQMRRIEGAWRILDIFTRVFPDALVGSESKPLSFRLVIDGETVLDESTGVVTTTNVGYPVLGVTSMFHDDTTLQIDNLRVGTTSQRFSDQPSNAIAADPSVISVSIRGDGIPVGADIQGALRVTGTDGETASGQITLFATTLTMETPIEVLFAYENLPLTP